MSSVLKTPVSPAQAMATKHRLPFTIPWNPLLRMRRYSFSPNELRAKISGNRLFKIDKEYWTPGAMSENGLLGKANSQT
jgi:hypothetical protein